MASKSIPPTEDSYFDELLKDTPIHEIFRRSNFHESIQYDKIKPVLRLASRFLRMKRALPYWYMLLCSVAVKKTTADGREYFQFSRPTTNSVPLETVANVLESGLSELVTFSAKKFEDHTTRGTTKRVGRFGSGLLGKGYRSKIKIDSRILDQVYLTMSASLQYDGEDQISLYPLFRLAQSLIHELAHAARVASESTSRKCRKTYIMEGCTTSEEGFEMEAAYFGGRISLEPIRNFEDFTTDFANDHFLVLSDWPTVWYEKTYTEKSPKSFVLGPADAIRNVHALDRAFVSNFFEDWFWDEKDPQYQAQPALIASFIAKANGKFALILDKRSEADHHLLLDRIRSKSLLYIAKGGSESKNVQCTLTEVEETMLQKSANVQEDGRNICELLCFRVLPILLAFVFSIGSIMAKEYSV